jgi:hypothetical protein
MDSNLNRNIQKIMKKNLLNQIIAFVFLLSISLTTNAQVKIGNNPTTINANSVLEVESTNKGILMPRVALTGTANAAPLTAHVGGMTVYNNATAGDVTPGYYYNNGTKWVRIADASGADAVDITSDAWVNDATTYPTDPVVKLGSLAGGGVRTQNTRASISDLGYLGLGTNYPSNRIHIASSGPGYEEDDVSIESYGPNTSGPGLFFSKGAGSYVAPQNTINNSTLMTIDASAVVNGDFATGTRLIATYKGDGTNNLSDLIISTSSVGRFTIDPVGNVGIGTTVPTSKLQIIGLPQFNSVAEAQASPTITAGAFYVLNGSADDSIVRIKR